jgi:hypothetical protein
VEIHKKNDYTLFVWRFCRQHLPSKRSGRSKMDKDIIIGTALIFLSLGCIFYITYWSRKTINFIHKKKLKSAREILTKLDERR